MLSEEERKVIERIEDTFYQDNGKGINKFKKITLYEDGISDIIKLLNIFEKRQKENEEKDNKVRKIIKRLDNDYKRITETKTNKSTFPNYLDDYTRCRLKAYRTKTREIKEYIEQQYFEKLAKEKGKRS